MPQAAKAAIALILFIRACAAVAQVGLLMEYNKADPPVLNLPFTADLRVTTVQHLDSGITVTREVVGHMYRSSSGLERTEGTAVSNDSTQRPPTSQAMLIDRAQRKAVLVHAGTATLWHLPPNARVSVRFFPPQAGEAIVPSAQSPKPEIFDLGQHAQDGLSVIGTRVTRTVPRDGQGNDAPFQETTETWTAPELNLVVGKIERNPILGEHTYELTNIRREEPDPTLFQVPKGYKMLELPDPAPKPRPR